MVVVLGVPRAPKWRQDCLSDEHIIAFWNDYCVVDVSPYSRSLMPPLLVHALKARNRGSRGKQRRTLEVPSLITAGVARGVDNQQELREFETKTQMWGIRDRASLLIGSSIMNRNRGGEA